MKFSRALMNIMDYVIFTIHLSIWHNKSLITVLFFQTCSIHVYVTRKKEKTHKLYEFYRCHQLRYLLLGTYTSRMIHNIVKESMSSIKSYSILSSLPNPILKILLFDCVNINNNTNRYIFTLFVYIH